MFVNREEFIQELILREHIREIASARFRQKKGETSALLQEEKVLRDVVRKLIKEAADEMAPHENTGINVLADLLKKIVPQLETEFKMLTTDAEQRESFRAHVINATQNALATSQSVEEPGEMEMELPDLEEPLLILEPFEPFEPTFVPLDFFEETLLGFDALLGFDTFEGGFVGGHSNLRR